MYSITINAPAKINLSLKVLGKRADGYHEIETLMLPVSLHDRVVLQSAPAGIQFWCDHPKLQSPEQNLAFKAALALESMGSHTLGANIKLYKQIPLAAGLGGGSSDAAAVIKGLNRLWKLNLSQERLLQVAGKLGADVPFFIQGRPAIARGKGEKLQTIPFCTTWLVIINPGFGISTADVYAGLNQGLTKKESYTTMPQSLFILFRQLKKAQIASLLNNDLENPVIKHYPVIAEIKQTLLDKGAQGALMSGSGSSVFGLFASRKQAEAAYRALQKECKTGWSVFLTYTLNQIH